MKSPRLRRALLALGGAAGVLFGLEPFGAPLFWLFAPACYVLLADELRSAGWRDRLLWSLFACLAISSLAFQWLVVALIDIGRLSWPGALALFVFQSPLLNLKLVLILLGGAVLTERTALPRPLLFGGLGAAGDLFTYQAFPWFWGNLAGSDPFLRQFAALGGVFALSFLVYFGATLAVDLVRARRAGAKLFDRERSAAAALLVLVYAFGLGRLATLDRGGETVRVAFFQPVTGRALSTDRDDRDFVARALNISFNYGLKTVLEEAGRLDLLVIPESAVPFHGTAPTPENTATGVYSVTFHGIVAYLARLGDVDVLYNELDVIDVADDTVTGPGGTLKRPATLRNLATIYGREGRRRDSYHKQKLVPFGEYLPGENLFPWLRALFPEADYYRPGGKPATLEYAYRPDRESRHFELPGREELESLSNPAKIEADWPARAPAKHGRLAPLVCYEGMWPWLVRGFFTGAADQRPDFLINISNDAWFGDYLANWQHFDAVRIRAIETNRYLVRATLTGAGGVIDPTGGDAVARTPLGREALRAFDLPRRPDASTIYLLVGEWPMYILLLVLLGLGFLRRRPFSDSV